MDAPEPEWKCLSGFAIKKGAAKQGPQGSVGESPCPMEGDH